MAARLATAVFLEFRTIPVLLWSYTAVALGTAVAAAESGRLEPVPFLLAMAIATMIQGFTTHTLNEIYDLRSGTDLHPAPRLLSGGSRVLTARLLSLRGMWVLFGVSTVLVGLAAAALVALRGLAIAVFVGVGYAAGIVYTLPPVATSYRPFLGEWGGGFLGVFMGSLGASFAQNGIVSPLAVLAAGAHAFVCVGMLLVHHYLDREADAASVPPKRTTVVFLGFPSAKTYTLTVAGAAVALFTIALVLGGIAFVIPVAASVLAFAAHLRIVPRSVGSVTSGELRVIEAGIAGGVGAAIVLSPALWPLAPIAAVGYAAHLRIGSRFAAVPPAAPPGYGTVDRSPTPPAEPGFPTGGPP